MMWKISGRQTHASIFLYRIKVISPLMQLLIHELQVTNNSKEPFFSQKPTFVSKKIIVDHGWDRGELHVYLVIREFMKSRLCLDRIYKNGFFGCSSKIMINMQNWTPCLIEWDTGFMLWKWALTLFTLYSRGRTIIHYCLHGGFRTVGVKHVGLLRLSSLLLLCG